MSTKSVNTKGRYTTLASFRGRRSDVRHRNSQTGKKNGGETGADVRPVPRSFDTDAWVTRLHAAVTSDFGPFLPDEEQSLSTLYRMEPSPELTRSIFCRRQVNELLKSYIPETVKEADIRQATIEAYLACQERLDRIQLDVVVYLLAVSEKHHSGVRFGRDSSAVPKDGPRAMLENWHGPDVARVLRRARTIIEGVLRDFPFQELIDACKFGTGVNLGVPYRDTTTSQKLKYPITATAAASRLFHHIVGGDPLLLDAIKAVNKETTHRPKLEVKIVTGGKFGVVPKDATIGRGIEPPPTLNGFLQQGIATIMVARLREVGLDLEFLQEEHQRLAIASSRNRKLATVDLRRASDNWMTGVVRWFFARSPDWLWYMEAARTDTVNIDGVDRHVHSYATMGNAFCFPLETLLFWAIACSCLQERTRLGRSELPDWELYKTVSVYGDDCILPSGDFPLFSRVLSVLGHQVNEDKTFADLETHFRESCGVDAYGGCDIRPFRVQTPKTRKRRSSVAAWLYNTYNHFSTRCIQHLGSGWWYSSHAFREFCAMFSSLGGDIFIVPPHFPEDSGLRDTEGLWFALDFYGVSVAPRAWDRHCQCRIFPFLSWRGRDTYPVLDEVRYWERRKALRPGPANSTIQTESFGHRKRDVKLGLRALALHFRQYDGPCNTVKVKRTPTDWNTPCFRAQHDLLSTYEYDLCQSARAKIKRLRSEGCLHLITKIDEWLAEPLLWFDYRGVVVVPGPVAATERWEDRRKGTYAKAMGFVTG